MRIIISLSSSHSHLDATLGILFADKCFGAMSWRNSLLNFRAEQKSRRGYWLHYRLGVVKTFSLFEITKFNWDFFPQRNFLNLTELNGFPAS